MLRAQTILCIGNDPLSLNLRCSLLKEQGWNVLSSGSSHDGVKRFGREKIDVVVLDLNGDGAESALIAAELKRQKPDVPLIMLVAAGATWLAGAADLADVVINKSDEAELLPPTLARLFDNDRPS